MFLARSFFFSFPARSDSSLVAKIQCEERFVGWYHWRSYSRNYAYSSRYLFMTYKPVCTLRFVGPIWPELIKKMVERTKIGPIYKNLLPSATYYECIAEKSEHIKFRHWTTWFSYTIYTLRYNNTIWRVINGLWDMVARRSRTLKRFERFRDR